MRGRALVGQGDRHWVTLADESPLLETTPAQLEQQYEVEVRAVRRHGKLDYSVNREMSLQPGDCLLLQGERDRAQTVAQLAVAH
jgi:CPA2 family monovalent cation:H+ antiporter-2